ncbi:MAG: DUF4249 domain-containing protein [Bacteroidales bacterium]|nr:DUF4249 domain-containing protein [Bacteroidales bacterium]MCF8456582.1 DUF4249 domain-containing protein [Bacteroidales bacterium]
MKIGRSTYRLILIAILALLVYSCEDDITFEFANYDPKVVVDASIEEGDVAKVFLTRSRSYFDPISDDLVLVSLNGYQPFYIPRLLSEILILDAEVVVSDGSITDTLEIEIDKFNYPYVMYKGKHIVGETGGSYYLSIRADSKEMSAVTSIPESIPIDSLWFEPKSHFEDSIGYIHGIFDDPPEVGNYFRVFTKTIGRDSTFVHPWNSVGHDRDINGEEDIEFSVYHGANDFEENDGSQRWYFKVGEEVIVKFCTIDNDSYEFWRSFQQNAGGAGNPFASPAPTITNIEGGLGVWTGYGVYTTIYKVQKNDSVHIE